jgi:hypothetical protein
MAKEVGLLRSRQTTENDGLPYGGGKGCEERWSLSPDCGRFDGATDKSRRFVTTTEEFAVCQLLKFPIDLRGRSSRSAGR